MCVARRLLLSFSLILLSAFTLAAEDVVEHKVKWYEDAQTICNRNGISLEELLKANSLRYDTDVKPGMTLRIPKKVSAKATLLPKEEPEAGTSPAKVGKTSEPVLAADVPAVVPAIGSAVSGTVPEGKSDFQDTAAFKAVKNRLKAGLVLPLKSAEGGSENYTDFYGGALLAIDEAAREHGIGTELQVIDLQEEPQAWDKLKKSDFIIGPVNSKDLGAALDALPAEVTVVSPLDPRCEPLTAQHANLIQAPTPVARQWVNSFEWMKKEFITSDKLFVLFEKGSKEEAPDSWLNRLADSCGIPAIKYSYKILDGREVADELIEQCTMVPDAVNRVIIASDNQAFVNDAVRNLRVLVHNGCKVVLYGTARIKSFDTIEVENLHSLSFRMSATYNVDYNQPAVQRFLLKYRALYNTEPTAFAFQGYDLMKYMLILKSGSPQDWENQAINKRIDLLQESFLLSKQGQGWVNTATREVVYGSGYNIETYQSSSYILNQ